MRHITRYLQRQSIQPIIANPPHAELGLCIVIPCLDEPDIIRLIEQLQACTLPQQHVEILIVVNHPEDASDNIRLANTESLEQLQQWQATHASAPIAIHPVKAFDLPLKHAGVGLARKIGMDEAICRFTAITKPNGIIASLDADCHISDNYLHGLLAAFNQAPDMHAATLNYAHRLEEIADTRHRQAMVCYELFLRYIELGWRYAGLPFAFTAIGSCFAVRANAYARHHGMNRRKAGEDFYFLHKLAREKPLGYVPESTVYPSARMSTRTPFGTGQAISGFYHGTDTSWLVAAPDVFTELRCMHRQLVELYTLETEVWLEKLPQNLADYLNRSGIRKATLSLRQHTAGADTFVRRFYTWFDGLKAWRYVNQTTAPAIPVEKAVSILLEKITADQHQDDAASLLMQLRYMDSNER